ncbi:restriction endonuclease [Clavibacter michiganensis]|uniref:site-specific DNA-methyltransferase (adenine-specific) n=1 Tax=Clavibacter michiganensis TaxID=28447 RepID=A0A2S5VL03_9MICO|nr:Eco57I restriction-modification methylase domain-containing protein [Clavibacter michiganensis]PPF63532.1 restriction endonuclease [Clavibacter michiganensis]
MTGTLPAGKQSFALRAHNPDVLTCIANLSNDEVFTPPELANQMLDTVAIAWAGAHNNANIWHDPNVTFLDPSSKSGVFLREVVARLTDGLADQIPDLQERVNHILTKQVYGLGITQLTALLARRSLYCSKDATSKYSIASSFDRPWGNLWFERTEHTWASDKCAYCGASKSTYGRSDNHETHAYAFLHTTDPRALLARLFGANVQFDVIIGNPPYQLSDGGGSGSSAVPIYQKFVEQAMKLEPRLLSMIIKANWYTGGKGLDQFRSSMLTDRRLRFLADFPDSREAFDGVDIAGGVCYFLWNRDNTGTCVVETRSGGVRTAEDRILDEYKVFVRDNRVLRIAKKIAAQGDKSLSGQVSARRPFGIDSAHDRDGDGDLYLFASSRDGRINRADVPKGANLVDSWKVLVSKTSSEHAGQTDKTGRRKVLSRIEVMPPGSVATESYLILGPFRDATEAANAAAYLRTRFVRFLLSAVLLTQNITRESFAFVPALNFDQLWNDEELYERYELDRSDVELIESQIKKMDSFDE